MANITPIRSADTNQDEEEIAIAVGRVEKLRDERTEINEQIKDVFRHAKAKGLNVKALKRTIQLKAMSEESRAEQDRFVNVYRKSVGIQDDLFKENAPE